MTQPLSNPKLLKTGFILVGFIILTLAWVYLAGYLFLEVSGLKGTQVTYSTLYEYWTYYGHDQLTKTWLIICSLLSIVLLASPLIALLIPRPKKLYGDARFATNQEIKKAGLLARDGIILGKKNGKYIIFDGTQHVLMAAPTRAGKGVSIVIPNLLSWDGSVIVLDIKDENWDMTAGYRQAHGHACYRINFAPTNYQTHRYNPLHYISSDPNLRINDIHKIGRMIFPDLKNESPIWQASARGLWLGLVLYLLETDGLPVTLGEVLRQVTLGDTQLENRLKARAKSAAPLSDTCTRALMDYLDTTEKTRSAIKKTFTSALEIFFNPLVDAATSENDFDIRRLRKDKMSIYLCLPVNSISIVKNLINLFYQQVIDLNTEELPQQNPEIQHKLLILADEFTSVGNLDNIAKGISFIAGYGIRLLTIIQSASQLNSVYDHHTSKTMIENHAVTLIFRPKDASVAKDISVHLGNTTITKKSTSRQLGFSKKGASSENSSEEARALLLPQEVQNLDASQEIILSENCRPIMCDKIIWYKDPVFKTRGNNLERQVFPYPSPAVPTIDPVQVPASQYTFFQDNVLTPADVKNTPLENIGNIAEIEIPSGDIDDDTMKNLVDTFMVALQK